MSLSCLKSFVGFQVLYDNTWIFKIPIKLIQWLTKNYWPLGPLSNQTSSLLPYPPPCSLSSAVLDSPSTLAPDPWLSVTLAGIIFPPTFTHLSLHLNSYETFLEKPYIGCPARTVSWTSLHNQLQHLYLCNYLLMCPLTIIPISIYSLTHEYPG